VGVTQTATHEQGAGDQGMMFGFACRETPQLMPLPIMLAHGITMRMAEVRKKNILDWVRPDGKSQVTVEYEDGKPKRVDAVVVAIHHNPKITREQIKKDVIENIIRPVCGKWIDGKTNYYVNETGVFSVGGPEADTGVTGRKIIVDTYGGYSRHGGGCFSGKDPSKVDRSATYAARYIAKNIVASGLADKCEVQLAYSIGVAKPVSVYLDTFGTAKIPEERISELVEKHFPLKPAQIISDLNLKRPIYKKTAAYGHFGREDPEFTWERTDKADLLRKEAGI
jgi:S-adenosylmethionine synthetase